MRTKNVFVIGAAKCGTTSLCKYLSKHPDISECSIKEPNFFCKDFHENLSIAKYNNLGVIDSELKVPKHNNHAAFVTDFQIYESLFRPGKIRLDGSTNYIFSKTAAEEIWQYDKDAKIIAILRDPIHRAYSHYLMDVRTGMKVESFEDEVFKELANYESADWHNSPIYIKRSIYHPQLSRFIQIFGQNRVKIILFEDLVSKNQQQVIESVCNFIEIPYYASNLGNENLAKSPRFQTLNRIIYSLGLKNFIRDNTPSSVKDILKKIIYKSGSTNKEFDEILKIPTLMAMLKQDVYDLKKIGVEISSDNTIS